MRAFAKLFVALTLAGAAATGSQAIGAAAPAAAGPATGDLGEMTLGNPKAKVTVVEYASVTCPHCAAFNAEVYPAFKAKYIDTGKINYVFRELLTPPQEVAAAGFLVARCGGKAKYFTVVDAIFRGQQEMFTSGDVKTALVKAGGLAGLSEQQVIACATDEAAQNALSERQKKAINEDGINSTPTFVINGTKLEGEHTLAQLDAVIEPLLKKK